MRGGGSHAAMLVAKLRKRMKLRKTMLLTRLVARVAVNRSCATGRVQIGGVSIGGSSCLIFVNQAEID